MSSCGLSLRCCSGGCRDAVYKRTHDFFGRVGAFTARRPWTMLAVSHLLAFGLTGGILLGKWETRFEHRDTLTTSESYRLYNDVVLPHFGEVARVAQMSVSVAPPDDESTDIDMDADMTNTNMLSKDLWKEALELQQRLIFDLTVESTDENGIETVVTYDDLCLRLFDENEELKKASGGDGGYRGPCAEDSIVTRLGGSDDGRFGLADKTQAEIDEAVRSTSVDLRMVAGKLYRSSVEVNATSLRFLHPLRGVPRKAERIWDLFRGTASSQGPPASHTLAWEAAFLESCNGSIDGKPKEEEEEEAEIMLFGWNRNTSVFLDNTESTSPPRKSRLVYQCVAERSLTDEINRNASSSTPYMVVSINLILILMWGMLGSNRRRVRSGCCGCLRSTRMALGIGAVHTIVMGMGVGGGIAALVGVPLTDLSLLLVFVVVGVGVDDVIVMVDYVDRSSAEDVETRITDGVAEAGPAILLTSTTNLVAFLVAALADIPSVRYFCLLGGIVLFVLFVLTVTMFLALLVFDERRRSANRLDCLCCFTCTSTRASSSSSLRRKTPSEIANKIKVLDTTADDIDDEVGMPGIEVNVAQKLSSDEDDNDSDSEDSDDSDGMTSEIPDSDGDDIYSRGYINTNSLPRLNNEDTDDGQSIFCLGRWVDKCYGLLLNNRVVAFSVIFVTICFVPIGFGLVLPKLKLGSDFASYFVDGSYFVRFYDDVKELYVSLVAPTVLLMEGVEFGDPTVQVRLRSLLAELGSRPEMQRPYLSWLDDYLSFAAEQNNFFKDMGLELFPTTGEEFYGGLMQYLTIREPVCGATYPITTAAAVLTMPLAPPPEDCDRYVVPASYVNDIVFDMPSSSYFLSWLSPSSTATPIPKIAITQFHGDLSTNSYTHDRIDVMDKHRQALSSSLLRHEGLRSFFDYSDGNGNGNDNYNPFLISTNSKEDITTGPDVSVWAYSFLFDDRDSKMLALIRKTLVYAAAAVLVVLAFFLHPVSVVTIAFGIASIDGALFVVMYLWDIPMDSVAFFLLAMAIGLSVDYVVHVAHAFEHSSPASSSSPKRYDDVASRIRKAVQGVGTSVAKGGTSTFTGIVALAFAQSSIFRTFFKLLFSTVLLGLFVGLVYFPACMVFVGSLIRRPPRK